MGTSRKAMSNTDRARIAKRIEDMEKANEVDGLTPAQTEWIPLNKIRRDPRVNTRSVDDGWVDKHVPLFDAGALGVPAVSRRDDATYVWLDGQNRGALMRRAGWSDQSILCQVYEDLDLKQEAALFLALNDGRGVKAIHKFLARITQEDPIATGIKDIVEASGWKIDDQRGTGHINAVVALERIYRGDRAKSKDGLRLDAFEKTIRMLTQAWGHSPDAMQGLIILGLGGVFLRYGDAIDTPDLTRKLASYPGGPMKLLGDGRGLAQFRKGAIGTCISEVIVNTYNRQRRSRTLPDWRS